MDIELFRPNRGRAVDGDPSVEFVFGRDVLETYRSEFPGQHLAECYRDQSTAVDPTSIEND